MLLLLGGWVGTASAQHQEHDQADAFWASLARNHSGRYVISAGPLSAQSPSELHELGQWSGVIEWPHIPVSAANLPDGRLITWSSNQPTSFPVGPEYTYAAVWDPATGQFVETPNHTHDMFCSHMVMLEDGRLLVNGGRNHVKTTSIFDFTTNTWTQSFPMKHGRWYPTTVALPDGTVFTASGSGQPNAANTAELWRNQSGWTELTGVDWQPIASAEGDESNWWPHVYLDPRGNLFHAGPTRDMHQVTTAGQGAIQSLGPWLEDGWYSKHAAVVMYDEGRLLIAGGAAVPNQDPSTSRALTVDLNGPTPVVTEIAPMTYARRFANAVMLPNGEVLVVGGNTSGFKFSDEGTILPAEIWSPETGQWRTVASISEPRNYHSIALLLEDGRVLSAGGGLCGGGCAANHQDGQLYEPPYLFDEAGNPATRPVLIQAPAAVGFGQNISVRATGQIAYFSLIKASATTHAVNTDQRYLRLDIQSRSGDAYALSTPANRNVMTPGYWMLFAVDPQGVPSQAASLLVSTELSLSLLPVGNQISTEGQSVSLQLDSFVPGGTTASFLATGLPPGLSLDSETGLITGTLPVGSAGLYPVEVTLASPDMSHEIHFQWSVRAGSTGSILREWWSSVGGDDISDLTSDARYPDNPSGVDFPVLFEGPRNQGDFYGARYRGFLHPLETGLYRFWIASDNQSELYLSTTSSPSDAQLVASVPGYTSSREWDDYPEQASPDIALEAGHLYYVEVLHKEGAGGDNLSVAWQTPSTLQEVIPGGFLSPFNGGPALADIPDQNHVVGATVSLQVQASDSEGDPIAYGANGLPGGIAIDSESGLISGTLTTPGTFQVTLSASDGSATNTSDFVWVVTSGAPPLEIVAVSAPPTLAGQPTSMALTVSGSGSYSVEWNLGDGTTLLGGTTQSHTYASPGRYQVLALVRTANESAQISFFQNIHTPLSGSPARSGTVAVDGQGRVWNVNPDNSTVAVTRPTTLTRVAELPAEEGPSSLFIRGSRAYVIGKESATLSTYSTETLVRLATVDLPFASRPHGVVVTPDARHAFVTLEATGRVARVDLQTALFQVSGSLGPWLQGISLSGDGTRVFATRFITPPVAGESSLSVSTSGGGELLVLRAADLALESTVTLAYNDVVDTPDAARGIANYLATPVVSPDGTRIWIPSKFDNIFRGLLRDGQPRLHDRLVRGGLSVIDAATLSERFPERLDIDDQSHPVAAAFGPRGNVLFVAHAGSRSVSVMDPWLGQPITRIATGRAPTGLAVSADGTRLYVHNYMDRTLQVIDVSKLTGGGSGIEVVDLGTVGTVEVESLPPGVLRGKQLFNDARDDRLGAQDYLSCSSCHAGGAHDGRVWDASDVGEGLRNTIDLRGRGGTDHGPVHWTANFDEIHDFEGDIRSVFGGAGLMTDADFEATRDPLGPLKAGRSPDLDALAAYVASLRTTGPSPFRNADGSLGAAATAGREVFVQAACADCHSGRTFTDSPLGALHDIGTLRSTSGQRAGQLLTGIDTPTLRGVWATAPYLHDGSAPDLASAVRAHQGVTLAPSEVDQLVAFLRSIDDEESQAPSQGTPPVLTPVPDQETVLGQPVSLTLTASESDGDPVSFSAGGLPPGLSISPTGILSGNPTEEGVWSVTARATDADGSDAVQFLWRVTRTDAPVVSTCYLVADNGSGPDVTTQLVDGIESVIGSTGTSDVEGIGFIPGLGKLFAADGGRLGRIDLGTGAYQLVGSFGSARHPTLGSRTISDVNSLTYSLATSTLLAVATRSGEEDLLIAVDPATGRVVPDYFGSGQDYVPIGTVDGVNEVDDIASNPLTGVLYGIGTRDDVSRLFTLDAATGQSVLVGRVNLEIEGLGFTSDGRLFGTAGGNLRLVVELDPATAAHTVVAALGAGGADYEAIDCMGPVASQRFAGRVFQDVDGDGRFTSGDLGYAGARVDLYHDVDANGVIGGTDTFLRFVTTSSDGSFDVLLGSLGGFLARVDYTSLPAGATPVSDNLAGAVFTVEGQEDTDNLFPFTVDLSDSDLFCYAVADEGAGLGDGDVLTRLNKGSLIETTVGPLGTQLTEAIAFNPQQTVLYAANGRRFGRIDLATGRYTEIGSFGSGQGAVGVVSFSDVDGLTFDPNTGVLYGAVRRTGLEDLLIQIDPATGRAVGGAFSGADYVVVNPVDGRTDVDDLAVSPIDGKLYAILNNDAGAGRLVTVNRQTGQTTPVRDLDDDSLEGLTFDGDGTLLATRGSSFQEVVILGPTTGDTRLLAALGVDGHRDYEALSCLTNQTNVTAGRVYADMNGSGTFDGYDVVLPEVKIGLYRDVNGDGVLAAPDILLATTTTNFSGAYAFRTASRGRFLVSAVQNDYFSGARIHTVSFEEFGLEDSDNDFVVSIASSTESEAVLDIPVAFALHPAYPNPFNPSTTIGFDLPLASVVRLDVFDLTGRRVSVLADGMLDAGSHRLRFEADHLPSGMYFYRMVARGHMETRSVILVK